MKRQLTRKNTIRTGLIAGVMLLAACPASGQEVRSVRGGYEVVVEHHFEISTSTSYLEIDNYAGDVEIMGSRENEIILVESVLVDTESRDEALRIGSRYLSEVRRSGARVTVSGAYRHGDDLNLRVVLARGMESNVSSLTGDLTLRDADSQAELNTGSGDIVVDGLRARLKSATGSGDITVRDTDGPVSGVSGAGDVTLRGVRQDVDVTTGAGDLDVSGVTGRVEMRTGGGDIEVDELEGDLFATTAGGDIEVDRVRGSARLSTSGGSIEVTDIAGNLDATTLGGDIEGDNIGGRITAESLAGDIEFDHVRNGISVTSQVGEITVRIEDASFLSTESIDIRADNGDIRLYVPGNVAADVSVDLGFDGEFDDGGGSSRVRLVDRKDELRQGRIRRVTGRLGRGGGRLELQTESGRISLRER
jgi:DUF4097 and DUF4098 domain-containing protein YvlB